MNYCRTVILLALLCAASASKKKKDKIKSEKEQEFLVQVAAYMGQCMAEVKFSAADISSLTKSISSNNTLDQKSKCYINCVGEKLGVFKAGALVEEKVLQLIEEDRADNKTLADTESLVFNTCRNTTGTDACDFAAKILRCSMDAGKNSGMY